MIGDSFPTIKVNTTHGEMTLPGAYLGKWFVLFSHPEDFTPVCTTEFYSFQKHYDEFKELGCELIGSSVDQVSSHIKWNDWIKENLNKTIEFPVIVDLGGISGTLGITSSEHGTETIRGVYIVDPKGKVRTILIYPNEIGRNINEILRIIKALQTSDKKDVSIPANWPENELIGDSLILPVPKNEKEISKLKNENSYDWWFRYKK